MSRKVSENEVSALVRHFAELPDPRVINRSVHRMMDVLVMSICAVLCGAQTCTDFEDFGLAKRGWLENFLELPGGIPSHDTFRRVLSIIDPVEMERCFAKWVDGILGERKSRRVSIDGKSVGGSPQGGMGGRTALHLVNIYAHDFSLCLGQIESKGSGGETSAALEMLETMDIKDTLVLADAKFAVRKITTKIREKGGHYLVALKDNNRFYRQRVMATFEQGLKTDQVRVEEHGHGREEIRRVQVLASSKVELAEKFFEQWPDLKTLIRVDRTRTFEDKRPWIQQKNEDGEIKFIRNAGLDPEKRFRSTQETSYYLSSKKLSAAEAFREVRRHWGIENKLHWVLDVGFGEDNWLVRAKRLSRNLSAIRRIGLNLIRSNKSLPKKSIRRHMKSAGWNDEALSKLVFGGHFGA